LFARALPAGQKVLAVTGSNGKTTVTALAGALCRAAGLSTIVAGNIGDAVLNVLEPIAATAAWPDVFVLELSSFQLETTTSLKPTAATVLNVTENHLDRYRGMDDYAAAKARIFAGNGTQVLNRDDPRSMAMRLPGRAVETFGSGVPESEEEWGLVDSAGKTSELWLARGGSLLLSAADLALVGPPQCTECARRDGVGIRRRQDFTRRPGRRCAVRRVAAPDAAHRRSGRCALRQRFESHYGGGNRGRAAGNVTSGDIDRRRRWQRPGFRASQNRGEAHCRTVLLIGRDAPQIERAMVGTPVEQHGTLDAAVARAFALARPGDAVFCRRPARASISSRTTSSAANALLRRCASTSKRNRWPRMRKEQAATATLRPFGVLKALARSARCRAIRERC
jgi:UDP-N-acetylmuramoylalanine--D-glutamate ligase